jgi:hypothetical protein
MHDQSRRPEILSREPHVDDRCEVVAIPSRVGDQWLLTGRYMEMVWSEVLGPTATLLARRLGDLVELHPGGAEFSFSAVAASLGVPPGKVKASLLRLHRFGIACYLEESGEVRTSGLVPSVGPGVFARLSTGGRAEHCRQLEAAAPCPSPFGGERGSVEAGSSVRSGRPGRSL